MNVHSLGQLVMLAPASPRTLALIPPSNQALSQMVSQHFIFHLVLEPKNIMSSSTGRSSTPPPRGCCSVGAETGKYHQLKDHENNICALHSWRMSQISGHSHRDKELAS